MIRTISLSLFLIIASVPLQAALIIGETADAIVSSTGAGAQGSGLNVQNGTNTQIRTGRWTLGPGQNFATVYPFQLPNLGAIANPFTSAMVTFNLNSIDNTPVTDYGADLYGIDARVANTVVTSDFYFGAATDPFATKLEDSYLTSGSAFGAITSVDFAAWLNTQYAGGANAGNFVFLRISADGSSAISDVSNGYLIATADAGANQPFLTYTSIPEPSTFVLIGLCLIGMVGYSRRCSSSS